MIQQYDIVCILQDIYKASTNQVCPAGSQGTVIELDDYENILVEVFELSTGRYLGIFETRFNNVNKL
jgi:hypothetical protein